MEYIYRINLAVEELRRGTPEHEFFAVLQEYKSKSRVDSYLALDRMGFNMGIKAITYPDTRMEPGGWEAPGWYAHVRLEEGNPLSGEEHETDLRWFPESRYVDACVYAAQKQVKAMMKVANPAEHAYAKLD